MPDPTDSDPGTQSETGQANDDLSETVVASRILHQGRYLTFRIDTIERADGSRSERDIVGHPGAVAVLAIDPDGEVLFVRQFRVPAGRVLLEIPAGTLDVDPATGVVEDHAVAAKRELEEETGYRAGTWRHLASFWTAPGFATELMHLWLATDLRPADGERLGPDEDERLRLERMPLGEALAAAERGEVSDAKSLVGLFWLERLGVAGTSAVAEAGVAADVAPVAGGDAVDLTYRLRLSEYLGATAVLSRGSRPWQLFGLLVTVVGTLGFINGLDWTAWLPLTIAGPSIVSGVFTLPFAWLVVRRRRELIEEPTELIVDWTGVTHKRSFGESHLDWHVFVRVRELGGWFFLDTGAGTNHLIPKRAFSDEDLARFRRLIAAAGFGPDGRRRRPGR